MCHIHTSIVSRHLATRGNNKILCTPPPHIISSEEFTTSLVAPLPNSKQIKSPFLKSYLHKVNDKSHTTHIISSTAPTYAPQIGTPGFVDRPRWSNCTAVQMNGEVEGSWEWVDNNKE